jgi:dihydrofolate synthase/folylpolyglutamate synthase
MNYKDAWTFLDNLQFFKIKLGLESMRMFLGEVGNPQKDLKFIHLAGTNGKGSVGATLLSVLAGAGYRVGFYTSPHLSSVRERFRINDTYISEQEFAEEATRIHDILAGRQITYFEFTTALALLWFARQKVDVVILETGLGGRLDATNVVEPLVSIITNVSMDHEAYLGDTLAEVASEKAGIIKTGIPLVSGTGYPVADVALQVVEDTCRKQKAPLYQLGRDFIYEEGDAGWTYWGMERCGCCRVRKKLTGLTCSLRGRHQMANTSVALAALELLAEHGFECSEESIRTGLQNVRWPGRLEYACIDQKTHSPSEFGTKGSRRFLLDGAHNPAGAESLKNALQDDFEYGRLFLLWGAMADKDINSSLMVVASLADHLVFTKPAGAGDRSAEPEHLISLLPDELQGRAVAAGSVKEAIDLLLHQAGPEDLICVAGSLYLIGEVRPLLLGELA